MQHADVLVTAFLEVLHDLGTSGGQAFVDGISAGGPGEHVLIRPHRPASVSADPVCRPRLHCAVMMRERQLLAGANLDQTASAVTVREENGVAAITDGPFAETKELIAGYWIFKVKSKAEAIEWVKRCPNPFEEDCEIEIRQVFEMEDFDAEFTPELREQERRVGEQMASNARQR